MRRGEPLAVRLYRCNGCYRIYGQEIDERGNHVHLSPTCDCERYGLGMEKVNVKDW